MPGTWPLACSTLAYAESPLERALSGIASAGFDHVEIAAMPGYCDHLIAPGEPEGDTVARVGRALERARLDAISLSAHIDLVPAPPGHLPGYPADDAIAMLERRVRTAAALGASVVNTQGALPDTDEAHRLFLERIKRIADVCDRSGVILALEVADGLTASGESVVALMTELEGAPVWINFDTGNLPFYSGLDPVDEVVPMGPFIRHVHLKDHRGPQGTYDFPAIGDGSLDLASVVRRLADAGYAGPLSAEIEFEHPVHRPLDDQVDVAVRRSLDAMRSLVSMAP